jgi:hypothetical protein
MVKGSIAKMSLFSVNCETFQYQHQVQVFPKLELTQHYQKACTLIICVFVLTLMFLLVATLVVLTAIPMSQ